MEQEGKKSRDGMEKERTLGGGGGEEGLEVRLINSPNICGRLQ